MCWCPRLDVLYQLDFIGRINSMCFINSILLTSSGSRGGPTDFFGKDQLDGELVGLASIPGRWEEQS